MPTKEIIKTYRTEELDVIWKPAKCIHAAECVKRLPNVYKPNEKPWLTPEHASTAELIEQINACPSGALSFVDKRAEKVVPETTDKKVKALKNGPMMIEGPFTLVHSDGREEIRKGNTAICRCGASSNKPFCDGTHNKNGFQG